MQWLDRIVHSSAYGVCRGLGEYMGIAPSRIRLYFIYASFLTLGSPIIVYLFVAFWRNVRSYLGRAHSMIRE